MALPMTAGSQFKRVVQNRCVRTAAPSAFGPSSCRAEQAAEHRAQAHHLEERPADDAGLDHAGLVQAKQREINRRKVAEGGDRRHPAFKSSISGTENVMFSTPSPVALWRM